MQRSIMIISPMSHSIVIAFIESTDQQLFSWGLLKTPSLRDESRRRLSQTHFCAPRDPFGSTDKLSDSSDQQNICGNYKETLTMDPEPAMASRFRPPQCLGRSQSATSNGRPGRSSSSSSSTTARGTSRKRMAAWQTSRASCAGTTWSLG